MKKIYLAALFLASTFTSFAQTQIPNSDFENWAPFVPCSGIDSLGNFITFDEMLYYSDDFCNTSQSIIKSTDKYSGNYALKITGFHYLDLGISSNLVYLGTDVSKHDYGVPFTGRPTKLTGYYKFAKGGTDTIGISLAAYNNTFGEIFNGSLTISSSVSEYTKFELDLNYDPATSINPMRLMLNIFLSNANHQASGSTEFYIDNLLFEYDDLSTATTNYISNSSIKVFAAQKNIHFSEQVSDVHVVDMVGTQKIAQANTTQTINAGALNNGIYIVTYKYKDSYFSKKVVIE